MNALVPLPLTPRAKSTPTPSPSPAPPPSPGTWRHPKFSEIVSRRNASTFSEQDLKRAAFSLFALFLSLRFSSEIHTTVRTLTHILPSVSNRPVLATAFPTYVLLALRLYLLLNLSLALLPLFPSRANDTFSDIPLTPSQRALMGLPPSPSPSKRTPNVPAEASAPSIAPSDLVGNSSTSSSPAYITPPRYKRTTHPPSPSSSIGAGNNSSALGPTTPSSSRSISALYAPSFSSSSPLSGRGITAPPQSPASRSRSLSSSSGINLIKATNPDNPFSPATHSSSGSPLLQKALASNSSSRDNEAAFRTSFYPSTPGSGLSRSQSVREGFGAGIRSPASANGSGIESRSPAVNYKWLYEMERRNQARGAAGPAGLLSRSENIQF